MEIKIKGNVYVLKWKAVLLGLVIFFSCRWLFYQAVNQQLFVLRLLFYSIVLLFVGFVTARAAKGFAEFNTLIVGFIIGSVFLVARGLSDPEPAVHPILIVIPVTTTALTYVGGIVHERMKGKV